MKIVREGPLIQNHTVDDDVRPPRSGFYTAKLQLADKTGETTQLVLYDLTVPEMELLRDKFMRGEPLKVTIE